MKPLFAPILLGSGKILLLGSSVISLGLAISRHDSVERPMMRLIACTFLFFFFGFAFSALFGLSEELTHFFESLGNRDGLKDLILEALRRESAAPGPDGSATKFNLPAAIEQIWRTGVWGVVSVLSECFFLLSSLLLEIGREITLQLIWILYPLLIGVGPLFPGVTTQFLVQVFCVSLWWPLFTLITVTTSVIARHYMAHTHSWGLAILALELIACLMTCAVPMIASRLVSGAIAQTHQSLSVTSIKSSVSNATHQFSRGGDE